MALLTNLQTDCNADLTPDLNNLGGAVALGTYPETAEGMAAYPGLGSPSHIWTFAETSGDTLDQVGSADLAAVGTIHRGDTAESGRHEWRLDYSGRAEATGINNLEYSGQSFRIGMVGSIRSVAAYISMLSNADASPFKGYSMYMTNGGFLVWNVTDSVTGTSKYVAPHHGATGADDINLLAGINMTTGFIEMRTSTTTKQSIPHTHTAWATTLKPFGFGNIEFRYSSGIYLSYACMWVDSEAEGDFDDAFDAFSLACPVPT